MTSNIVDIHVRLLNEGVETAKRAKARVIGQQIYQILLPENYDPQDEEWEFVPGDIVRCEKIEEGWADPLFLAVEKVG